MKKLSYSVILLFLLTLTFTLNGYTAEPPSEPILRIETGMHTAPITRIGIDAENRYLVTGSFDKTVRVWELSTGRLLKVLRPPVADGDEGKIYAVAISPDGRQIACGGWTGWDFDGSASIYIFDRESGSLIKRITGLPHRITHLVYSKDGRYLVAGLRNNGIRVYKTHEYLLIKEDKDYGDSCYGADFDSSGRLVTTSLDGYIRLYSKDFNLIERRKAPSGKHPFGISFSPDGSKVAVGYNDSTKVDVLSGRDLSHLYSPDTGGVNNENLCNVTWSFDGRFLYAGGLYKSSALNSHVIRKWKDEGRGGYVDLPAAQSTIMHILPLKNGGIVFGSAEPSFGIIDASDRKALYKSPSIADYRDNWEGFLISYDGSTVQFSYELFGKSPARFSVYERLLELDSSSSNLKTRILNPPITKAEGLEITDWKYTYTPKLNGKALNLKQYEFSRSLAISPDGKSFLLGTEWYLRLFDRNGDEIWNVPAPSVAWAVNISGNGKLAVAAFGDGTIRWYRMRDGKEVLALFPHNDKKRWVIWTPSGYYDASPGADDIIGWHINNGKDREADFFPVSRFKSKYYRPDVVAKVFDTLDEKEAIRLANEESGRRTQDIAIKEMLPPVVTIISPRDGAEVSTTEITVKFSVRSPSGEPITAIKVLVDGRPVSTERGVKIVGKGEEIKEVRVSIPERDVSIAIVAENRYAASEPATVWVKWKGAKKDEFVIKPKLYILAIGVSRYEDKSLALGFASKDARDFVETMKKQKDKLYRDVVVKLLTDEKATKDEILDGLDWLSKETTSKDLAMVFLAGHGVNDQSGIYYFLPVNANPEKLKRTGVAFSDIKNTVASLAGKTIVFVDTCHSGNIMGARRGVADITGVVNELASAESGVVVFASSTGRQYSLEDPSWGNGAFTKALVEGISGRADYVGKGKITINMLDLYLSERVKELTKGKQTPTTTKPSTVPDFPVAVRK
jgi:WD40 repeat protein